MAGTKQIFDGAVILRALIGVFNQQPDAGAGSDAFKHAGQNAHPIRLAALSGIARGARTAPVEIVLQIRFGERHARRHAVDNTAQRNAMRFTKGGDAKNLSNRVACHLGSVIVRLIFEVFEMMLCVDNLLTGQHKYAVAAVIKFQPVNGTSGYCSIICTILLPTSQISTPSSCR